MSEFNLDQFKESCCEEKKTNKWNFIYGFVVLGIAFLFLLGSLINLQLVNGQEYSQRSQNNRLRAIKITPNRGIIYDRNGKKLVENVAVNDIYLDLEQFECEKDQKNCEKYDIDKIKEVCETLQKIDETYVTQKISQEGTDEQQYYTLFDKVSISIAQNGGINNVLLIKDSLDKFKIDVLANIEKMPGVFVQEGTKRNYPYKESFGHLLGYVSKASEKDLVEYEYLSKNDLVGKAGLEKQYDKYLSGEAGELLVEVDSMGRQIDGSSLIKKEPVNGKNVYLSIDANWQQIAYDVLSKGVEKTSGDAGALIVEDISNGQIVVMASYPNYDNNLFIGGISKVDYDNLMNDPRKIFLNRAIASQQAPGSIFKTIVLSSALDSGVINKNTKYLSSSNYKLASSTYFFEYNKASYGWIDLKRAIAISSNIYPCETIRNWDINELAKYFDRFNVGEKTGIDLPGEISGLAPTPENKKKLVENGSYWLDSIWYEPADSCYSVIGQGITLVTPIQAANWASVFASGGKLYTPHLATGVTDKDGEITKLDYGVKEEQVVNKDSVDIIRQGMREVVVSGSSYGLRNTKYNIAAKTGTSETGKKLSDGSYEQSHSWVTGFFPYEEPKYAFAVFIENGGKSYNAQEVLRDFVNQLEL